MIVGGPPVKGEFSFYSEPPVSARLAFALAPATIYHAYLIGIYVTRGHGQEGALAPLEMLFLCISYSKTPISRRIIYVLFSQPVSA